MVRNESHTIDKIMAIGFKPKSERIIELQGYSSEELMCLAVEASKALGWQIGRIKRDKSEFYTPTSLSSWQEKVTLSTIEGKDGQLLATSVCTSMQWIDWGKNQKNLDKLESAMRELRETLDHLPAFEESDEDTLSVDEQASTSLRSILTFDEGYTATPLLFYVNVALFVAMVISGVSLMTPTGFSILEWGANFGPLTLTGDWWRTITCNFIHIGLIHIVMNMYALLYIGGYLEQLIGKRRLLVSYLLTGLFAALSSLMIHPETISAGASGSIFGLYGIFLAFLIFHQRIEKGQRKSLLYSIGFFVIYNLMIGAREEGIDNAAHVGGLVSGLLLGGVYLSIERYASKRNPKVISYIAEGVFALIFVFLLAGQTSNLPSDYTEIRNLWDEGTLEEYVQEAIAEEDVPEENTSNLIGNDKSLGNGMREYVNEAYGFSCVYPERWTANGRPEEGQILQLNGNSDNGITVNYIKVFSTEEIDQVRELLLKAMDGHEPENITINGQLFERISGTMDYPIMDGGSILVNQSVVFHLDKQALKGYIIVVITTEASYESEAQAVIESIKIEP